MQKGMNKSNPEGELISPDFFAARIKMNFYDNRDLADEKYKF